MLFENVTNRTDYYLSLPILSVRRYKTATDEKWTKNGTGRTSIERQIRDETRISISSQHKNSLSSKKPIGYCKLKKSYEPALQDRAHLATKISLIFHVDRLSRRYQRHSQDAISFD